jgi:hypothetical protein
VTTPAFAWNIRLSKISAELVEMLRAGPFDALNACSGQALLTNPCHRNWLSAIGNWLFAQRYCPHSFFNEALAAL